MSDDPLTDAAKAEIAAAIKIVREDKHFAMLSEVHKRTEPKPEPTPPPTPPTPPPTPPTPPTPPPAPGPTPPPPKPPTEPPPTTEPPKRRSAYWGDLD